jgi:hypothetical protein
MCRVPPHRGAPATPIAMPAPTVILEIGSRQEKARHFVSAIGSYSTYIRCMAVHCFKVRVECCALGGCPCGGGGGGGGPQPAL